MGKEYILIVEDNVDNFELVRSVLEHTGYQALPAIASLEGVNTARRG